MHYLGIKTREFQKLCCACHARLKKKESSSRRSDEDFCGQMFDSH